MPTPQRTRLFEFMYNRRIRPGEILRRIGVAKRGQLDAMRYGRSAGSAATMAQIRAACADILGVPVGIEELFEFPIPATSDAAPAAAAAAEDMTR